MDALRLSGAAKTFTMHLQDGIRLPVIADVNFAVDRDNASCSRGRRAPASRRS
jgi:alpha-D-ribose 1-methylphosphonate 5-triphosphate synthase subunit PhnL